MTQMHAVQAELQQGVDSISRRLASLSAAFEGMEGALERLCERAEAAVQGRYNIIILSDRMVGAWHLFSLFLCSHKHQIMAANHFQSAEPIGPPPFLPSDAAAIRGVKTSTPHPD